MESQEPIAQVLPSKRNLSRRAGACNACKLSKVKCDGHLPSCTACTKKRHSSQCVYGPPSRRRGQSPQEEAEGASDSFLDLDTPNSDHEDAHDDELEQPPHRGPPCVIDPEKLFGGHSMARCIDQFRSLAATQQSTARLHSIPRCSGLEAFETTDIKDVDSSIEDGQQLPELVTFSLPQALSKSMSPYLRNLYEEALRVQRLIRLGKLIKAWIGMPRLIRLAQLDRMDHNQTNVRVSPETLESELRRRIWWFILDLDVQVGMHIGRPLAVRVQLGIDRPTLEGLEGAYKDLEQSRLDFNQYALEVLDGLCVENDQPGERTHDTLVEVAKLDRLQRMEKRLPHLTEDEDSDEQLAVALADYKIELLAFKMMLCCSLARSAQKQESSSLKLVLPQDGLSGLRKANTTKLGRPRGAQRDAAYTYQRTILDSARSILATFEKISSVNTLDRYCNWNRCFDAYCAVAILAIATLRQEARLSSDVQLITTVHRLLRDLADRDPYCHLAIVAVTRTGQLCAEIEKLQKSAHQTPQSKRKSSATINATRGTSGHTDSQKSSAGLMALASSPSKKRKSSDFDLPAEQQRKRIRPAASPPYQGHPTMEGTLDGSVYAPVPQRQLTSSRASRPSGHIDHDLQARPQMVGDPSSDAPTDSAVLVDANTGAAQYSPYFGDTGQVATASDLELLWQWHHPPLARPQIPFVDIDTWNIPPSATGSNLAMHQTTPTFQNNVDAQHTNPFDHSTTIDGSHGQSPYFTQNSLTGSMSYSANHPLGETPHMTNMQTPQTPGQGPAGLTSRSMTGAAENNSSYGWEFVQHQQHLSRRTSHYHDWDIPTTTAAWG